MICFLAVSWLAILVAIAAYFIYKDQIIREMAGQFAAVLIFVIITALSIVKVIKCFS